MGAIATLLEKYYFPIGEKNQKLANLQFLQGFSPPHAHTYACETKSDRLFRTDSSSEPVFSPPASYQLPFIDHSLQQRVERIGRYSAPAALLKGLATGEVERQ